MDFNFITKKSNSIIIIFRVADDGYFIVLSPYVKGQKFFCFGLFSQTIQTGDSSFVIIRSKA